MIHKRQQCQRLFLVLLILVCLVLGWVLAACSRRELQPVSIPDADYTHPDPSAAHDGHADSANRTFRPNPFVHADRNLNSSAFCLAAHSLRGGAFFQCRL
jgi:hypothetical protein